MCVRKKSIKIPDRGSKLNCDYNKNQKQTNRDRINEASKCVI